MTAVSSLRSRLCVGAADSRVEIASLAKVARAAALSRLHLSYEQSTSVSADMTVVVVSGPPLAAERPGELDAQLERIRPALDVAAHCGAALSIEAGPQTAAAWGCLPAGISELARSAERLGVDVLLHNRCGTRLEQPMDLHRVFVEVDASNVMLDLDVAEFHLACVNPVDPIRGLERRIGSVRLSNVIAHRPAPLGRGEIDVRAVLRSLREAGYTGPIILAAGAGEDAAERLADDCRYVENHSK